MEKKKLIEEYPLMEELINLEEVFWFNDYRRKFKDVKNFPVDMEEILEAEKRLENFAPFLGESFEELKPSKGIIESNLTRLEGLEEDLDILGDLYLKEDNSLPVAGSIKARGGIYEVLKHTEDLARREGLLREGDSYLKLANKDAKEFFKDYIIQVGSTGNLGLSIGMISAKIGYRVIVHMSSDAKEWKKDLLRKNGVEVIEYEDDYSEAVKEGRRQSDLNPRSYFIDDEKSMDLFLGYGVAALRLKRQLKEKQIEVNEENPLCVYIPCGVGGAPGGVAYGLKLIFKDNVHIFFAEPTHSPCMLMGIYTKTFNKYSVQDFGIDNITAADGLAVGRASEFVSKSLIDHLGGLYTIGDEKLYKYLYKVFTREGIYLEPSACAGFLGAELMSKELGGLYFKEAYPRIKNITHIVWGTGGSLVPEKIRKENIEIGRDLIGSEE